MPTLTTPHDQRDLAYHEAIAPEYEQVVNAPRAFANDILFSVIDPLVRPGERMLDIGCGTGQMLVRFGARYRRAIGVDHSAAMLKVARTQLAAARIDAQLECASLLEYLGGAAPGFDLVSCGGCMHHLERAVIDELLAHVARLLHPEGVFLYAEPVRVSPETLPAEVAQWNARSIAIGLGYSVAAEDPDEAPMELAWLEGAIAKAGLRTIGLSRGWELFPHAMPPTLEDRASIWRLHHQYGANGNVYCAVACRA